MTFSNAIANISPVSQARNAAKIPSWHGYVWKTTTGMSDEDVNAGKYQLRFVKSDGSQYVFTWDGAGDYAYTGYIAAGSGGSLGTGDPVVGTTLALDADLLEALTYDTWDTYAQSYLDAQRTTEGAWN